MSAFKLGKMTLGSLFKKPETVLYPFEQKAAPAGRKGHIVNDVNCCILCGICSKRCPTDCISVDKPNRTWTINHFQCVQCGTCVRECPKSCLAMDPALPAVARTKADEIVRVPVAEKVKKPSE